MVRLSSNFREATQLVLAPLPARPPAGCLLVKRVYAGVNASDVNYSAGRCGKLTATCRTGHLPYRVRLFYRVQDYRATFAQPLLCTLKQAARVCGARGERSVHADESRVRLNAC